MEKNTSNHTSALRRKIARIGGAFLIATGLAFCACAGSVSLGKDGISIGAGNMGSFKLEYPKLKVNGKEEGAIEVRLNDGKTSLKYASGATVTVNVEKGGKVGIRFDGNTTGLKSFKLGGFMIPFSFSDGGTWRVGTNGAFKPFPAQKPAKPFLYQGNSSVFEIASIDGKKLKLDVPPYSFIQLQDNREWGWKIFGMWMSVPFNKDWPVHYVTVSFDSSEVKDVKLVDRFGQTTRKDFPGKIKNEEELKADIELDKEYYASFKLPTLDKWGGLPNSAEKCGLKKTGFFHVEKKGDKWLMADPDGNAFFHMGVCSFGFTEDYTYVEGRENIYEWLPPHTGEFAGAWHPESWWNPRAVSFLKANEIRKNGKFDEKEWTEKMIDRIRLFGFNSIGAFSGSKYYEEKEIPYVGHLPLGHIGKDVPGVRGVYDPFNQKNQENIDKAFSKSIAANADKPLIIGYFLANEQGMEDIPRAIPKLDGKYDCKLRLVSMLEEKYKTIDAFNDAWKTDAKSFDELKDRGLPVTTKPAFADMHAYVEIFLDAYYKGIADAFHKYDKNHMLIGNRWQPGTANNETLCRVAGKYMDIISINYYAAGIDSAFVRRLYNWTGGKPQMWSEFYYTGEKESNVAGSGMDVGTQEARGKAYRQYVEGAASIGFVVGIEWFTLVDQAVTGRFFSKYNGERYNTGLFNVADRPYKAMITEMIKTNNSIYDVWVDGKAPFVFDHPKFSQKGGGTKSVQAGHKIGEMKIDGLLEGWPGRPPERIGGDRLVSGRES
ncbi:MAG: beta-galactosidase, partial [Planctomycetes bacterium]|nr:beta-galactosidase [Planctomycetota bacterium]